MTLALAIQSILSVILLIASLGTILSTKPVHCCLYFLLALLSLSGLYAELSAEFMAVMQILIYAGAILVIFMFVMVLFQDAHAKILKTTGLSSTFLLTFAGIAFLLMLGLFSMQLSSFTTNESVPQHFGTAQSLGKLLYLDFFFPFEASLMLFLIACVGTVYIGKKET